MNKLLLLFSIIILGNIAFSQSTIFEDDMEGTFTWSITGANAPNSWLNDVCAGNGPTVTGSKSLYISSGDGSNPGCTSGLGSNYDYRSAAAGVTSSTIIYNTVPTSSCASNMTIVFDARLNLADVNDNAAFVYSTDNGATWTFVQTIVNSATGWQTYNIALPAALNNTNFQIGFRFTYNDIENSGTPLAIDNVKVVGDDIIPPTIACPGTQSVYADAGCESALGNYINLITVSDNCTSIQNLTLVQSPAPGNIISTNTAVQITVTDESGNEAFCSLTVSIIDTIKPTLACLPFQVENITTPCDYLTPDLSATVDITDNCTTNPNFTISQNPAIGTPLTGIQDVIILVTDQAGNTNTCITRLLPNDSIVPTITCPADVTINNGTACSAIIADYVPLAVTTENCPNATIRQFPDPGSSIPAGETIAYIQIGDELNHFATCNFKITVIETQAPVITNCPNSIQTCNPLINYSTVTASDNCLFKLVKTDLSGLSSGSTFPVGITPIQYTAIDSSGNTAVCNFTVEVYPFPTTAALVTDVVTQCETTTATITAVAPVSGTGTWSNGTVGTGTIATPNSTSTSVSGLSTGTNEFIWTVTSAHCGSSSITAKVIVQKLPTTAVIVQDTLYSCNAINTLVSANQPVTGTSQWSTSGTANIANPNQPNTFATQLQPGWNKFYYTISNGTCPPSKDSVSVFANKKAKILSSDTSFCQGLNNYVLVGETPEFGQKPSWFFVQGYGEITAPNATTSAITQINSGSNLIVYAWIHPICGTTYDTLSIAVNNCTGEEFVIPSLITPNFDGKNDLFVINNLYNNYPQCSVTIVNRWGSVVFESTGYKDAWDGTYKEEDLPMGTYFYRIDLNDKDKTSYSGPISIIR